MQRLVVVVGRLLALHRHVGDHPPVVGDRGVPGEDALQVGLVEAGEDLLRVGRLELAVEVGLAVDRVDGAVQPLPAVGVGEVGVDHEGVLRGQAGQDQALLGGPLGEVEFGAVEGGRADRLGGHLDEGGGARLGTAEGHLVVERNVGPSGGHGGAGQVESDVVPGDIEQAGPLGSLDLCQVTNSRHCVSPSDLSPPSGGVASAQATRGGRLEAESSMQWDRSVAEVVCRVPGLAWKIGRRRDRGRPV